MTNRTRGWKSGLAGFVGSTILFMALPLPEALPIREQVAILLVVQVAGVLGAVLWVRIRDRKSAFPFDLRPGSPRPGSPQRRRIDQFLD